MTPLLNIEKEAFYHLQCAKYFTTQCQYDKALEEIERSIFLLKTDEAASLRTYLLAQNSKFEQVFLLLNKQ